MHAGPVQQRQVQIRQRCPILIPDVLPASQAGRRATRDQNREVHVVVQTRVTHPAPVQVDRIVEQRALTIRSGPQLLDKLREQRNVERVDLGNFLDLYGVIAMVTRRMVRIWNADFRIRAVAELARELEADDPRDIGLKR